MPGRTLLFVGLIALAVVGPYLLTQSNTKNEADGSTVADSDESTKLVSTTAKGESQAAPFWQAWFQSAEADSSSKSNAARVGHVPLGRPVESRTLGGPRGLSLADVLRFDIQPAWIAQNWSSVTATLGDLELSGMRVPLVSGTEPHDVAGSLTYYFNRQQAVQRIQLSGYTNDPEPLTALMTQRFGLRRYAAVGSGMYLRFEGTNPVAVMRLGNESVFGSNTTSSRFRIDLELNAIGPQAQLSRETLTMLHGMRKSNML